MKSIGRLLLLGAALALLAPTSSWADHTNPGSRHDIRRHARTNHRADHHRPRPRRRPSVSLGYSHYGGVIVRFGYGYRNDHHYQRRASYRHDRYYQRHLRRHGYDRHTYDDYYHRGHH